MSAEGRIGMSRLEGRVVAGGVDLRPGEETRTVIAREVQGGVAAVTKIWAKKKEIWSNFGHAQKIQKLSNR